MNVCFFLLSASKHLPRCWRVRTDLSTAGLVAEMRQSQWYIQGPFNETLQGEGSISTAPNPDMPQTSSSVGCRADLSSPWMANLIELEIMCLLILAWHTKLNVCFHWPDSWRKQKTSFISCVFGWQVTHDPLKLLVDIQVGIWNLKQQTHLPSGRWLMADFALILSFQPRSQITSGFSCNTCWMLSDQNSVLNSLLEWWGVQIWVAVDSQHLTSHLPYQLTSPETEESI